MSRDSWSQELADPGAGWLGEQVARLASPLTIDVLMGWLIALAQSNVRYGAKKQGGGPYAAAVVRPLAAAEIPEHSPGNVSVELVSFAVNAVERCFDASAHAPALAARFAGARLQNHDLGPEGAGGLWLVSTSQPCGCCLGVLRAFRLFNVLYAVRGSTVQKAAAQDRGIQVPPIQMRLFRMVQLPAHQNAAAAVIGEWVRRLDNRGESNYNAPLDEDGGG